MATNAFTQNGLSVINLNKVSVDLNDQTYNLLFDETLLQ